jgi:hypothetical protein
MGAYYRRPKRVARLDDRDRLSETSRGYDNRYQRTESYRRRADNDRLNDTYRRRSSDRSSGLSRVGFGLLGAGAGYAIQRGWFGK